MALQPAPMAAPWRSTVEVDPMSEPLVPVPTVKPTDSDRDNKRPPLNNVRALLHKNRLLKQRQWCSLSCGCCGLPPFFPTSLFCELLLPVGLVLFLWWARDKCVSSGQCVGITVAGWGGDVPVRGRPSLRRRRCCRLPPCPQTASPGRGRRTQSRNQLPVILMPRCRTGRTCTALRGTTRSCTRTRWPQIEPSMTGKRARTFMT